MTYEQFALWLSGYIDGTTNAGGMSPDQVAFVRGKLTAVFQNAKVSNPPKTDRLKEFEALGKPKIGYPLAIEGATKVLY